VQSASTGPDTNSKHTFHEFKDRPFSDGIVFFNYLPDKAFGKNPSSKVFELMSESDYSLRFFKVSEVGLSGNLGFFWNRNGLPLLDLFG